MTFDVAAEAYGSFMGRFSEPLADAFVGLVVPRRGQRALDVGAGTGALTRPLAAILGAAAVTAVEPSGPFAAALRTDLAGVEVVESDADRMPFPDDAFDLALAQLVVHFLPDPTAGLAEMVRVTAPGGTVGASVWDFAGGRSPVSLLWRAAGDLDPSVTDESGLPGAQQGDLVTLLNEAGSREVRGSELSVSVPSAGFHDWWAPYTLGVGPAGAYVAGLTDDHREALRDRCRELLPPGRIVVSATAWVATGVA